MHPGVYRNFRQQDVDMYVIKMAGSYEDRIELDIIWILRDSQKFLDIDRVRILRKYLKDWVYIGEAKTIH